MIDVYYGKIKKIFEILDETYKLEYESKEFVKQCLYKLNDFSTMSIDSIIAEITPLVVTIEQLQEKLKYDTSSNFDPSNLSDDTKIQMQFLYDMGLFSSKKLIDAGTVTPVFDIVQQSLALINETVNNIKEPNENVTRFKLNLSVLCELMYISINHPNRDITELLHPEVRNVFITETEKDTSEVKEEHIKQ